MVLNISPLVLIINTVLYLGLECFGVCLLLIYSYSWLHDVFPLGCGSIHCALETPVKNHVVYDTLSGTSSRVIRGKLWVSRSTFI